MLGLGAGGVSYGIGGRRELEDFGGLGGEWGSGVLD